MNETICLIIPLPQGMQEEDYASLVKRDVIHFHSKIDIEALYVLSNDRLNQKRFPSELWFKVHIETLNTSDSTSMVKKLVSIGEKTKNTILIDISCFSSPQSFHPVSIFAVLYGAKLFYFKDDEIIYFPVVKRPLNPLDEEILVALKTGPVKSIVRFAKRFQKSSAAIHYRFNFLAKLELIEIKIISRKKRIITLTSIGSALAEAFSELVLVKNS